LRSEVLAAPPDQVALAVVDRPEWPAVPMALSILPQLYFFELVVPPMPVDYWDKTAPMELYRMVHTPQEMPIQPVAQVPLVLSELMVEIPVVPELQVVQELSVVQEVSAVLVMQVVLWRTI
jgi:hypothetical protein